MHILRHTLLLSMLAIACLATSACVGVPVSGHVVYHDPAPVCVPGHWRRGYWVPRHCNR